MSQQQMRELVMAEVWLVTYWDNLWSSMLTQEVREVESPASINNR